jgi:hypothetical protein
MDALVIGAIVTATGAVLAAGVTGWLALRKRDAEERHKAEPPREWVIAEEIGHCMNRVLMENQSVLGPVIWDPRKRFSVGDALRQLFDEQEHRLDFGRWQQFLKDARSKHDNPDIQAAIDQLSETVRRLHEALYGYGDDSVDRKIGDGHKLFVAVALREGWADQWWSEQRDASVVLLVEAYLNYLREQVERTGKSIEKLRTLIPRK